MRRKRNAVLEKSGGEVLLHELAEAFAIFVFHVHEFDAVAVRTDVADDGGGMDFAQAGANLELDGIAWVEAIRGFDERATQRDGLDARHAHSLLSAHLSAQRRVERNSDIEAWNEKVAQGRRNRLEGGASAG